MALEIIDVNYDLDRENPTGTVYYKCGWSEASTLAADLVGGIVGGIWVAPATFPITGLTGLRCSKASVGKWGNGTWESGGGYKDAAITAQFGVLKNSGSGSSAIDLAEISTTVSGEGISLPKGKMKWTSGDLTGKPLGEDDITPTLIMPFTEVALKVKYCTSDGLATMASLAGYLNSSTFSVLSLSAPDQCVMFLGGSLSVSLSTMGYSQWSRDLRFAIRQQSWNTVLCMTETTPTWRTVSPVPFKTGNLTTLFS